MSRSLSYTRVSHKDSSTFGMSLESQDQLLREYHRAKGLPPWAPQRGNRGAGRFEDAAVSAWRFDLDERPDGGKLVRAIQPGDHVIIASMDRGFRSVENWAKQQRLWDEQNVTVHFVRQGVNSKSAAGRLICNVLASFAQFKSDMLSERLRMSRISQKHGKPSAAFLRQGYQLQGSNEFAQIAMALREMKSRHLHKDPGTVYGYIRCSHLEQLEADNTLPAQQQATEQYMRSMGLQMAPVLRDEAISAWTTPLRQRPSGRILCDLVRAGDHVVFPRLDRAFRSIHDMVGTLKEWDDIGVVAHFVDTGIRTDSREGRVLLGVLACLCEYESQVMSETIQEGYAASGKRVMLPPWITKTNDKVIEWYVPDYRTIQEIYEIQEMWYDGMTGWGISDEMERRRIHTLGCLPIPRSGIKGTINKTLRDRFRLDVGDIAWDPQNKGLYRKWTRYNIFDTLRQWEVMEMEVALMEGEDIDPRAVAEAKLEYSSGSADRWGPRLRLAIEHRRAARE